MNNTEENKFYEISLKNILDILLVNYKKILIITIFGASISLLYSLTLNKLYISESVSLPAQKTTLKDSSDIGVLNIFAAGAGYSSGRNTLLHLKSRTFFKSLIAEPDFLPELMAYDSYDINKRELFFDKNKYDSKSKTWLINTPIFEDAYEVYMEKHFTVYQHMTDEFITIRTKHISPEVAVKWNNTILRNINKFEKNNAIKKSTAAIQYYESELEKVNTLYVKNAMIMGISEELNRMATSEVDEEYALEIIDEPFYPNRASEPALTIFLILGTLITFMGTSIVVILKDLFFSKENNL